MPNQFDIKSWLTSVGVPESQHDAAITAMGPAAIDRVKDGWMAQSDYSRNMDQLRTQQAEATTLRTQLDDYANRINTWKDGLVEERTTLLGEVQRLNAANGVLRTTMQYEFGANPDEIMSRTPWNTPANPNPSPSPANPAAPGNPNPAAPYQGQPPPAQHGNPANGGGGNGGGNPAFSMTDVNNLVGGYAVFTAMMGDLQEEHRRLFGGGFSNADFVRDYTAAVAQSPGLKPNEFWEQKFNVPSKRQELHDADVTARIEAARKEGYDTARREVNVPGAPVRPMQMLDSLSPTLRAVFSQPQPQAPNAGGEGGQPPPASALPDPLTEGMSTERAYWDSVMAASQDFHDNPDKAQAVIRQYGFGG